MSRVVPTAGIERKNADLDTTLSWLDFLKQSSITRLDIFLLGMTGVLSSGVTAWSSAADHGYWILFVSTLVSSIGYVILSFCVAEMTSALPFSGGIYGFVRAFTTPLLGFIVAMFELTLNLSYLSPTVYLLSSLTTVNHSMILVNCLIIYLIILALLLVGGRLFWILNTFLGFFVLVLFLVYIFGSCSHADFTHWAEDKYSNYFTTQEFLQHMPIVSTCYLGIQLIPLTSRCASTPKKDIPIVMCCLIAVGVVIICALFTLASSQYPGIHEISMVKFPLTFGFQRIFSISYHSALWLNAPFLFAAAFTFTFFCGRQTSCMAKSGLLPEVFLRMIPFLDTPYISLVVFVSLSFLLNIVTFYDSDVLQVLYLVSSLSSLVVYILALIGFIRFHKRYSSLERFFASPFGDIGAYVGIVIFAFCFVGGAIFQDTFIPIVIIALVAILPVIYYLFLSGEHVFSEEEREELFKAYIVNANLATKKRLQKRGQVTPQLLQGNNNPSKLSDPSRSVPFNTEINSITREGKNPSLIERVPRSIEDVIESNPSDKENQVSSAAVVMMSEERVNNIPMNSKSLSERVKDYLSSKMNQILPDPIVASELQELGILQAGGRFNDDGNHDVV